jgi:hypothetical protein
MYCSSITLPVVCANAFTETNNKQSSKILFIILIFLFIQSNYHRISAYLKSAHLLFLPETVADKLQGIGNAGAPVPPVVRAIPHPEFMWNLLFC